MASEDAVLPWLITRILCASAKGLIMATSALDLRPDDDPERRVAWRS